MQWRCPSSPSLPGSRLQWAFTEEGQTNHERNQVLEKFFSKDRIRFLLISFLKSTEVLRDLKQ